RRAHGHVAQYPRGSLRTPDVALGADTAGGLGAIIGGAARHAAAAAGWAGHLASGAGAPRGGACAVGRHAAAALCAGAGGRLCAAARSRPLGGGGGAVASAPGHGETDGPAAQAGPHGPRGADQRRGSGAAGRRARGLGLTSRLSAARRSHVDCHADIACGCTRAVLDGQQRDGQQESRRALRQPWVATSIAAAIHGRASVTASLAARWQGRSPRSPHTLHASGTRGEDSPLDENPRYLITMSAALVCEAGHTLGAMPMVLLHPEERLLCESVVHDVSHNQTPQS